MPESPPENKQIKVVLVEGGDVTGRILASAEESVTLDVEGSTREVPYADIAKALVQVEFNRKKKIDSEDA